MSVELETVKLEIRIFIQTSLQSLPKVYFMKLLPVIFERNDANFGAIAGQYGEKIQRNCSQKEPKKQDKIYFRQAHNYHVCQGTPFYVYFTR